VLYKLKRFAFLRAEAVLLTRAEWVGHLVGRRPRLGANYSTKVVLFDGRTGKRVSASSYHLTADAQKGGGGYKKDPRYLLRVLRHKREKRHLGADARKDLKAGRIPILGGDSNFHGMTLGGLVNCWVGSNGGSLGWRAVDIIFAPGKPKDGPYTLRTRSDHRAVCVTY
jgi:hypothetical protein